MTELTKQVRVDKPNHAAIEQLRRVLQAEQRTDLAHNDVVTLGLAALAEKRPDLAQYIPVQTDGATAVAA
jgi:hypothetical protein